MIQAATFTMDNNDTKNNQNQIITYSSDALFKGLNEVLITHDGFTYRLRITRQGKLILHK